MKKKLGGGRRERKNMKKKDRFVGEGNSPVKN